VQWWFGLVAASASASASEDETAGRRFCYHFHLEEISLGRGGRRSISPPARATFGQPATIPRPATARALIEWTFLALLLIDGPAGSPRPTPGRPVRISPPYLSWGACVGVRTVPSQEAPRPYVAFWPLIWGGVGW
jgi:hypothetical protein